jgi:hypothetical protein
MCNGDSPHLSATSTDIHGAAALESTAAKLCHDIYHSFTLLPTYQVGWTGERRGTSGLDRRPLYTIDFPVIDD